MPVLRSARALAEAPITIVKKNPIDAKVKSLQDQLAAAHAQNERMAETMKEKDAEHARVTEEKDAKIESLEAEKAKGHGGARRRARRERAARRPRRRASSRWRRAAG